MGVKEEYALRKDHWIYMICDQGVSGTQSSVCTPICCASMSMVNPDKHLCSRPLAVRKKVKVVTVKISVMKTKSLIKA